MMNTNDFNEVIEGQFEKSRATLIKKATEYAADNDRLHNFKVAAKLQGITSRAALAGMLAKHTVSVFDLLMADDLASPEMWDEKMGDSINYHLLALAVIEEERREKEEPEPLAEWEKELLNAGTSDWYSERRVYFLPLYKDAHPRYGRVVVPATPNQVETYLSMGFKKYEGDLSAEQLSDRLDYVSSTRYKAAATIQTGYWRSPDLTRREKVGTMKTAEALIQEGWTFDENQED
jgi:hypothetical protein